MGKQIKLFVSLSFSFLLILTIGSVAAQDCGTKEECEAKIKEYEAKLTDIRNEKNSLSSQISLMNTQIRLTQTKIESTKHAIKKTGEEIETLGDKIGDLDGSLNRLSAVLLNKIAQSYKNRHASLLDIVLDSKNAATVANKIKYLEVARNNDRALAFRLQQTKDNFESQKDLREEKKKKLEDLQKSLNKQEKELEAQRTQKTALLQQTNNDEIKYQQLLATALAEFQAIENAIEAGQKVGEVKKGEPIALMGNTGYPHCSTGPHLHFEVRKDGSWQSPYAYLKNHPNYGGSGDWDWPMQDPIEITQTYGKTPWSWRYRYSGGLHTGIDMVSDSSDVIRAPADGTLYTSSQKCSSSTIKIKYIEHGSGVVSFYLHVQ